MCCSVTTAEWNWYNVTFYVLSLIVFFAQIQAKLHRVNEHNGAPADSAPQKKEEEDADA